MLSADKAREIAQSLVEKARAAGADSADAIYVGSESQGVQVRLGELEHVDRSEGEEVGLRVFVGHQSASVASSDFSPDALAELVNRGVAMAREAPEDPYAGLAPSELLAHGPFPDVQSEDIRPGRSKGFARTGARGRERRAGRRRRHQFKWRIGWHVREHGSAGDLDRLQRGVSVDRSQLLGDGHRG